MNDDVFALLELESVVDTLQRSQAGGCHCAVFHIESLWHVRNVLRSDDDILRVEAVFGIYPAIAVHAIADLEPPNTRPHLATTPAVCTSIRTSFESGSGTGSSWMVNTSGPPKRSKRRRTHCLRDLARMYAFLLAFFSQYPGHQCFSLIPGALPITGLLSDAKYCATVLQLTVRINCMSGIRGKPASARSGRQVYNFRRSAGDSGGYRRSRDSYSRVGSAAAARLSFSAGFEIRC
jgi:hypothetical protein